MRLVGRMNTSPPSYHADWTPGRGKPVSVFFGGHWIRGLACERTEHNYSVFLIDVGSLVNVTEEELRPLPEEFLDVAPLAYQVMLVSYNYH